MSELILAQDEKEVNSDGIRFAGWSFKPGEITPSELLVLTAIGAFVNGKNECWPSVPTLAKMSKVSKRAAQYCIRELAKKKIIKVTEQESSKTGNKSNLYKITVPRNAEWQKLKVIKLILGIENISRTEVLVLLAMVDHIFSGRYSNNFAFARKFTISQGDVAGKTGLLRDRVNLAVSSLSRKNLSLPEVGNDEWVALKVDKESEKGKKLIYQLVGSEKAIRQLVELIDPY